MKHLVVAALAVVVAVIAPAPARACLWDNDTLAEESLTDRDTAAVLRGELHKHSPAFYAAKVGYTRALVDAGTAPTERYDDLAVALARTGALDDALAVLAAKDQRFPGEYTTLANRGTFLAMKGDAAAALVALRAALVINPDAHFGREEFQVRLLEYKLRVVKDATVRERASFLAEIDRDLMHTHHTKHVKGDAALDRTILALTGLIRFGDGDRDLDVWYALAWALVQRGDNQLAALAFRRAERLGHPRAAGDGGVRATTLHDLRTSPCCPEPGSAEGAAAWAKASARIDRVLAKGAAKEARWQAAEDRRITRKQWRKAFGY
ncbi:MAG: hypothetical protein IPL61_30285 [Myxococcales bacterium]|nr:hypothetical protein [Myxococcales bacterium]